MRPIPEHSIACRRLAVALGSPAIVGKGRTVGSGCAMSRRFVAAICGMTAAVGAPSCRVDAPRVQAPGHAQPSSEERLAVDDAFQPQPIEAFLATRSLRAAAAKSDRRAVLAALEQLPRDEETAAAAFDCLAALAGRFATDERMSGALGAFPGLPGELLQRILRLETGRRGDGLLDAAPDLDPGQRRELVRSIVAYLPRLDEPGRLAALRVLGAVAPDSLGLAEVWMRSGVEATRVQAVQLILAADRAHTGVDLLRTRLALGPTETERCWIALALATAGVWGQADLGGLLRDPSPRVRRHAVAALSNSVPPWACIDEVPRSDFFEWHSAHDSGWTFQSGDYDRPPGIERFIVCLRDDDAFVRTAAARCVLQCGIREPALLSELDRSGTQCSRFERAWRDAALAGLSTRPDALLARLLAEAEASAARRSPATTPQMVDKTWEFLSWPRLYDDRPGEVDESVASLGIRWDATLALRRELALAEADGERNSMRGEVLESVRRRLAQRVVDTASQLARRSDDRRSGIAQHASRMGSPMVPLLASEWLARGGVHLDDTVWDEYGRALHAIGAPAAAALALGIGNDQARFRARIFIDWLDTEGLRTLLAPTLPIVWQREVRGELFGVLSESAWEEWSEHALRDAGAENAWIERVYSGLGAEALPTLLPQLDSCVAIVRARTCEALGALGPLTPDALDRIAALLDDAEPRVRYFAARTLQRRASAGTELERARRLLGGR